MRRREVAQVATPVLVSWRSLVDQPMASVDRLALRQTADAVFATLSAHRFDLLVLTNLEPGRVNGEHLALALRCLSSWKNQVAGWGAAVQVARSALIAEGKDPEDALFGLL